MRCMWSIAGSARRYGKEYRKKLYNYEEIQDIIARYGLPQDWNDDGHQGPERYIEVHVWSDEVIGRYMKG